MSGLRLRVGDHAEVLACALGAELLVPPDDPFARDVVAVTTPGQGRWLLQRLGLVLGATPGCTDGVAAHIDLPTPRALFAELELAASGIAPADDPWGTERLAWTMLRAFELAEPESWFRDVAVHLSEPDRPGRRYGTARHLCEMFGRYARWRPELLTSSGDGTEPWQHHLWAMLVELVGAPTPWERARQAADRLRDEPDLSDLPARVSLWAPERLAPSERTLLDALGAGRDVTVWWPTASLAGGHLLIERLGQAGRAALAAVSRHVRTELVTTLPQARGTLLARLQEEVRTGVEGPTPAVADGSVRVHLSHGLVRQVEVLRDVLCQLFDSTPGLEPRDVLVCTPQLQEVAPLVRALCVADADSLAPTEHPVAGLRVRVTDTSPGGTNPVLDVLWRLLDLATSRAELGDLLALCGTAPVARRFRLDEERLETLGELLEHAGVRWGVDSTSRDAFGLTGINQNTWLTGLNRVVLGVAMSERDLAHVSSVLPLDMVDSSDLELVGAVAEIHSIVRQAVGTFREPATPAVWVTRFRDLLTRLVDVSSSDAWQLGHAQALLGDLATASGPDAPVIGLGDMRHLVGDWLKAHPPRSTLLTGNLTVTSLGALRHVPHRVVCLLGVDEAAFPRASRRSGDDLLERAGDPEDPHVSLDDRQLFLDALMAATETFVVIGAGHDQRTNERMPLSAPVIDLLEAVERLGVSRESVLLKHALQPYEPSAEPTYDACAVEARRAQVGPRPVARDRFDTSRIEPAARPSAVTLAELTAFLRHPAREFLRHRVGSWYGISRSELDAQADEVRVESSSQIPVELDALGSWALENRLLELALAGHPRPEIVEAELRRGELPPGLRGQAVLTRATSRVGEVLDNLTPYLETRVEHLDVAVDLPSGTRITGRVPVRGDTVVDATTSKPSDKRLVEPWLRLMMLTASRDGDWHSVVCSSRRVAKLVPASPEAAARQLDLLVGLMADGWDAPLPLPPRLGYELADPHAVVDEERLRKIWEYDVDPTWRLFFTDLDDLEKAACGRGGLRRLAAEAYGPLLEAVR
jgi:exodeoxyribonuclease V gamma subunit